MNGICAYHGKSWFSTEGFKDFGAYIEVIQGSGKGGEMGTGQKVKSRGEWKRTE